MARGTTLIKLLNDYRVECRLSLNASANSQDRDAQVGHIQRIQQYYWEDFTWPHLRVKRDVPCQAGQRYYGIPDDLDMERIEKIEFKRDGRWLELTAGIEDYHYQLFDSDLDQRSWPVERWQITEGDMAEVWPIPNANADPTLLNGTFRFTGIRKLKPLVADTDTADLDDKMILLFCAAERLSASGAKDAQYKNDLATKRYARLRGELTKRKKFNMFSTTAPDRDRRQKFWVGYRRPGNGP